ncbi:MAG: bifunctional glutamate N-acetyltransferase/amino-acid acetyltransferase ArgJ [Alphaproteobacteria bacterium GM202ARS2]|nr:bifunctional glutamate N-acetyltransferase/amino-acid acetyltransferase ArgJ [Alphaproteobacteria bacterium GM202ARS2]
MPPSPFAPRTFPTIPPIDVGVSALSAGLKKSGALDLTLFTLPPTTQIAAVMTTSDCPSAAVQWCQSILPTPPRAILINAGNANAFTFEKGKHAIKAITQALANKLAIEPSSIYMASTGVIGVPLAEQHIIDSLDALCHQATHQDSPHPWADAAHAIMTTDTYAKGATATYSLDGQSGTIVGIAKGSGMIAPNMATMLAFIFTDAALPQDQLQRLLKTHTETTFNAITVDSDTSTSDTVMLCALGHKPLTNKSHIDAFSQALRNVMHDLAMQIVKDGEGAQKFITVRVTGAQTQTQAKNVALSIAESPLVKTAIAGEDANWGRIIMAIGKARQGIQQEKISITINNHPISKQGRFVGEPHEHAIEKTMREPAITIDIDLDIGNAQFTAWTCDFTHGYISINADYRS